MSLQNRKNVHKSLSDVINNHFNNHRLNHHHNHRKPQMPALWLHENEFLNNERYFIMQFFLYFCWWRK